MDEENKDKADSTEFFTPKDIRLWSGGEDDFPFYRANVLLPMKGEKKIDEGKLYLAYDQCDAFDLFLLDTVGPYDTYDPVDLTPEQWKHILDLWQRYIDTPSYDVFAEEMAGIDYEKWTVKKPAIMRRLSLFGVNLWAQKEQEALMLSDLLAWTELLEDRFDSIRYFED